MAEEHDMTIGRSWDVNEAAVHRPQVRRDDRDQAWQLARRVVASGSARAAEPRSLLHLQRTAGNSGVESLVAEDQERARSPVLDVVGKGGGTALPAQLRSQMEDGLGADFSLVRIHDGPAAAASAQAVQARAYTVGDEIVFNRGAYEPDSDAGRHTIAHELTHVVQQRSGPVDGTPTGDGVSLSDPGDRFERDAESVATEVMAGRSDAPAPAGVAGVQRDADDGTAFEAASVQRQGEMQEEPEEEPEEEAAVQTMGLEGEEPVEEEEPPA